MRGVLAHGTYLPHRRLDRSDIRAVAGTGGGTGTRTVASFDEDTTTMAVEAARVALAGRDVAELGALTFSTVAPAYADRTNATAIHAALRLEPACAAMDAVGAMRSASGALRAAFAGGPTTLLCAADVRIGRPGSPDEAEGGDGAAAVVVGDAEADQLAATLVGQASVTAEFVDRWRVPGEAVSQRWEERFGEQQYRRVGTEAVSAALADAGWSTDDLDAVAIAGTHTRAAKGLARTLKLDGGVLADDRSGSVGMTGAAQPALALSGWLETAGPGQRLALVVLADGAEVFCFEAGDGVVAARPLLRLADQAAGGATLDYPTYLRWRGLLEAEPPRRPEPARVSSPAAARARDFKFGFVGNRDATGAVQLPPVPGGTEDVPMADAVGTVATFTIDRLAASPSPPVVFAVVDFDVGGRLPVELTDVDADAVAIGDRVTMTFRRVATADGIHNYFWKARPLWAPDRAPDGDRPQPADESGTEAGGVTDASLMSAGATPGDEGS